MSVYMFVFYVLVKLFEDELSEKVVEDLKVGIVFVLFKYVGYQVQYGNFYYVGVVEG